MRVISVNTGILQAVSWRGRAVQTGIFKHSLSGRVSVGSHGLSGDAQADLRLHGGVEKAVYVYPSEHYAYWQEQFPDMTLYWGMFGENLSTLGPLEHTMHIGDRWRIGSTEFEIVQPREPCFKLGLRFGSPKVIKQFLRSGRSGWYLRVVKEGKIGSGDRIKLLSQNEHAIKVSELAGFLSNQMEDRDILQRALRIDSLPQGWQDSINTFLQAKQKASAVTTTRKKVQ